MNHSGARAARPRVPFQNRISRASRPRSWFRAVALAVLTFTLVSTLAGRAQTNATPPAPAAREILTVAVFDFDSKEEGVKALGPQVATIVNANLSAEPDIILVERAELEKILSEHELSLSGNVSADTAAKVGNLTGAKVLVTGRVFKAGKELVIVGKVIGTENSRLYAELVKGGESASITDLSGELAKKIATNVVQKGSTLVAKVVSPEQRIENLKKKLDGKKLPVLEVTICERHFGGPTFDPAAETEFEMVAQECGFKLATAASELRPDVTISGEAFSEFGMRKGNLISCKARVEIKVRDKATGNLIAVDRQTSVAVDITEQIAAKTALQNAALELAERILPKLAK
jgi:hypothetical protein